MARSKTQSLPPSAPTCDPVMQAETTLASVQAVLIETRRGMLAVLPLLTALPDAHKVGILLAADLELLEEIDRLEHIKAAYHVALAEVNASSAALETAQQTARVQQAATARTEREAALETDEEYADILQNIALYTRQCEAYDHNIETAADWRRSRYKLAEALKRKADKLAASAAS